MNRNVVRFLSCILIPEKPHTSPCQNMAPKVVHHEDVGLETGSSYSDVCVIDGCAVSSAKVGFVTTPTCRHHSPTSATPPRPSSEARLADVGLEAGSSYIAVCVIDGHAVSSANVGFVTTPSVSAPFSNICDVNEALIQGPTRRCRPRNRKYL